MDKNIDCKSNDDDTEEERTAPQFLDTLQNTVRNNKSKIFATWYNNKGVPTDQYTYQQIWDEAGVIAYNLRLFNNLEKGDRVILCYNFGLQFFSAFLGCLRAGIVAVPVYPPSPNNLTKALAKLTKIIQDADAKLILIDNISNLFRLNPLSKSRNLWPQNIKYQVHPKNAKISPLTNELSQALNKIIQENPIGGPYDLAFLQYTSGSTGDPKGVMVTFKALNANVVANIHEALRCFVAAGASSTENIVAFSWLPQYHDMGLIYTTIMPFTAGWNCNMISPLDFINNPLLWIDLMSRLKATWSAAPNFAYRLAARKFIEAKARLSSSSTQTEPIPYLDLSSIHCLLNAAEPIQLDTRDLFQQTFGSYGLHNNWFVSGYGLAESVVSATNLHGYKLSTFEPTLGQKSLAVGHRKFFYKGHVAKVVCPTTFEELGDQQVGELWLSGPSVTAGYFGRPQLTKEVFQAKIKQDSSQVYLRTGDLAFFENDYLYICGRWKDLIIVNGVNHYPQDIENTVQNASDAVRPGCVAAFSSNDTGADGDIEVVFEVRKEYVFDVADIVNMVRKSIMNEIGLVPTRVVVIKERTILKTTSGKIQRKANREALHNDGHKIIFEYDSRKNGGAEGADLMSQEQNEQMEKYDPFDKIMISFFGMGYDATNTWDELGLSSMATVSLRDKISDLFAITLDPECFEIHSTPNALKTFVLQNQGRALEVQLPLLRALKHNNLSWTFLGFLQGLFGIMLLIIFVISILSPWFVKNCFTRGWVLYVDGVTNMIFSYGIRTLCYGQGGLVTQSNGWMLPPFILHVFQFFEYVQDYHIMQVFGGTNNNTQWIWIPLAVPVCMLSFSLCVVVLKWLVVGKYREGIVPIPSVLYLRWWIVDRAVALWEFWVGRYILKTPLINLFYFLMGAKIHRTVSIESFIREFDLIEILQDSSLEFQIHCRKFGKWGKDEKRPSIRFRKIFIGRSCTVKGMVSVGASVGDNAIVEKLSVVQPGAKVPQGTHVIGNPAYIIRERSSEAIESQSYSLGRLGFLKLTWLVLELYIFYGTTLLGQYLWISHLPQDHRYTKLFKWPLLLLWLNFFSIFTSVLLKWVLIGKRRPGSASHDTLWRIFADWAADWHFEVGIGFFLSMTNNFRLWNIVLKMHGMDIDMASKIGGPEIFPPSKVDLITIKNSFVSGVVSFSLKKNGHYHGINIVDSSIGFLVHVDPDNNNNKTTTDLTISGSTVPPMAHVTSSIIPDTPDARRLQFTACDIIWQEGVMTLGYVKSILLLLCTMIPSYEFGMYVFGKTFSIWIQVPTLVGTLILQNLLWTLIFSCFQYGILIHSKKTGRPFSSILYMVYIDVAYTYQIYSFLYTFLGSPTFNGILKYFLGVQLEGRALLFPQRFYDFPYITIADRTIVDGAHVTGHYVVYDDVKVGPCKISGVLHEGCYAAKTVIDSEESESWRTFMGTFEIPKQQRKLC